MGRGDFGELLAKLEEQYGTETNSAETSIKKYDVIVAGGGPAGSAAAIYSARKGLNVAVIAERIGGQVKETVGIENLISVPSTTGSQLADNLKTHMSQYPIDLLEHRQIEKIELDGKDKVLTAKGGERFSAPAVIVATGASWRKLNVPGEAEYIGRGWLSVHTATDLSTKGSRWLSWEEEIPESKQPSTWQVSAPKLRCSSLWMS